MEPRPIARPRPLADIGPALRLAPALVDEAGRRDDVAAVPLRDPGRIRREHRRPAGNPRAIVPAKALRLPGLSPLQRPEAEEIVRLKRTEPDHADVTNW